MKKSLFIFCIFSFVHFGFAQNTLTATYPNDISTNYSLTPFDYGINCSGASLSVTLPAGDGFEVIGVDVTYNMTAGPTGAQTDQFSSIKFGIKSELTEATNAIFTPGTFTYNRVISIANGIYSGGSMLTFQLNARRAVERTPGCNTIVNKVDAGTWKITVHFKNNGGVGIDANLPFKGKLDVGTAAGTGRTVGAFGTDGEGISIQMNPPAIGFNLYNDATGLDKYMSDGKASKLTYESTTGVFDWFMYPSGNKNAQLLNGVRAISILSNGNMGIKTQALTNASLTVGYDPNNTDGTVTFLGVKPSYFNKGPTEDTYIRSEVINIGPSAILKNNTRIGQGGSANPVTALELFGALNLYLTKTFDISKGTVLNPGNSSVVQLDNNGVAANSMTLTLENGIVSGQILLIKADPNWDVHINEGSNMDLTGNLTLDNHDLLMLIWRVPATGNPRWTQLSFRNN